MTSQYHCCRYKKRPKAQHFSSHWHLGSTQETSLSLGTAPFVSEKKSLAKDPWRLKWKMDAKIFTCRRLIQTMSIKTWRQKRHTLRKGERTTPDFKTPDFFVHVGLLYRCHSLCTRWAFIHLLFRLKCHLYYKGTPYLLIRNDPSIPTSPTCPQQETLITFLSTHFCPHAFCLHFCLLYALLPSPREGVVDLWGMQSTWNLSICHHCTLHFQPCWTTYSFSTLSYILILGSLHMQSLLSGCFSSSLLMWVISWSSFRSSLRCLLPQELSHTRSRTTSGTHNTQCLTYHSPGYPLYEHLLFIPISSRLWPPWGQGMGRSSLSLSCQIPST